MNDVAKALLARHEQLKTARMREEPGWRELARLFTPEDVDIDVRADTPVDFSEIFDATHLNAADSFEGGIFSQLVNPANRWFELSVDGDPDLSKWGPVKEHLWQRAQALYASLSPASSSFYAEAPTWIGHVGVFGHGPFWQEERPGSRIVDRAMPIGEIYIDVDADGEIFTIHREYPLTGLQYRRDFGAIDGDPIDDTARYVIVHCVRANPGYRPGALGNAGKPWLSTYVSPDRKNLVREGGYYELPCHVPMWKRRAGRAYATGPGARTRPDVSTLQEMERSHLVAAQFAAEPPLLLHEDSGLTAADIFPNAMLHGTMNEAGKQLVGALNRGARLELSHEQSDARRKAIRDAWFFGIMQLVTRPQMTATEFLGFQEESLRLLGPNLVRIQTGGLSPFIARRNNILDRAGRMPPAPQELAGKRLEIQYKSPLAKLMQVAEARAVLQYHSAIEAFAISDPEVRDKFNADGAADLLHEAMVGDPRVRRSDQEVEAIRQARANRLAQEQQLADTAAAVTIKAENAHADQAESLARGRRAA